MRGVLVADFGRRSVAMPSGLTIMDSTAAVTGGHRYLRVGRSRDPAACRRAIAIKPDLAEAYCNLGLTMAEQRKLGEAIVAYRRAISIRPDLAEPYARRSRPWRPGSRRRLAGCGSSVQVRRPAVGRMRAVLHPVAATAATIRAATAVRETILFRLRRARPGRETPLAPQYSFGRGRSRACRRQSCV